MTDIKSTQPVRHWWLWSMGVPVLTLLVTAAAMSLPPNTHGVDIVAGGEVFTHHCSACHFTKVGFPAHLGPNLHDIGRSAASRKPGQSSVQYLLESILEPSAFIAPSGRPGMPADVAEQLSPQQIRNLVGFLASRGAHPDYDEINRLEIPDRRSESAEPSEVRLQAMQLAESVLREKGGCLQCHSLYSNPEGKTTAPGLFGVGLNSAKSLRDSIVNPHREIKHPYQSVRVVLQDGEIVTGQLVSRTDTKLTLRTLDDKSRILLREIPLTEVESDESGPLIREANTSLMPTGYGDSLTAEELDAVINLIRQLN